MMYGLGTERNIRSYLRSSRTTMLLLMMTLLAVLHFGGAVSDQTVVNDHVLLCFVFPNNFTDIGFSYNANRARLEALQRVTDEYGSTVTVHTELLLNCVVVRNFTDALLQFLARHPCDLVFSFSSQCLGSLNASTTLPRVAALYPRTRFIEYDNRRYFARDAMMPSNVRGLGVSYYVPWYAAGAAAAVQCRQCVGFAHPLGASIGAVNAFYRGMLYGYQQFGSSTGRSTMCPLYAISTGSFLDVATELTQAKLFAEKGCDVVAYWADSMTVSTYVASLRNATVFTIPNNVDGSKLWGDSVLTSVLFDFSATIYGYAVDTIANRSAARGYMTATNGSTIAAMSPRAHRNASRAALSALATQAANYTLWCGGFVNATGFQVNTGCASDAFYATYNQPQLGVAVIPRLTRATTCGAGTFARYNASHPSFQLTCAACPPGTISTANGSTACTACPQLFVANATKSGCVVDSSLLGSDDSEAEQRVKLITPVVVLSCAAGAALVLWIFRDTLFRSANVRWASLPPPQGPFVGLLVLAVNPYQSQEHWRQDVECAAVTFETLEAAVWGACRQHSGYCAYAAGDVYVVATEFVEDALDIARHVERAFSASSSAARVSLRFMVSAGQVTVLSSMKALGMAQQHGMNRRLLFRGRPMEELLHCFASWKRDVPCSIVMLPGSFSTAGAVRGTRERASSVRLVGVDASAQVVKELVIALHSDATFGVCQWANSKGGTLSVTTVTTPASRQRPLLQLEPLRHAADRVGGTSPTTPPDQDSKRSSSWSNEGVDFGSILLCEAEMCTLRRYGSIMTRAFISWLDVPQRKHVVRDAANRLHVRLNANTARRRDAATNKIFFGEEQVVLEIVTQVLKCMDEQELLWWLKELATLHQGGASEARRADN